MTPMCSQRNREQQIREEFETVTAKHELTIRHDDGLYRHLRIQEPGTWCYGHDIVTWPGYLSITGDAGDFVFARIADMFEFFDHGSDRINPHYWSEKLQAPRQAAVRVYSEDAYRQRVCEWRDEHLTEMDSEADRTRLRDQVDSELLIEQDDRDGWICDEQAVRDRLSRFEFDGRSIYDPWDWSLWEWDRNFLWCCWAIVRGIARYKASKA